MERKGPAEDDRDQRDLPADLLKRTQNCCNAIRITVCWRADPAYGLPAEMVRDQALAISGLLVRKIGGPSVKPVQPAGLWKEFSGGEDYRPDTGEGLHRRSLYTFWKRTSPPPMMMNFDSAAREACAVRENRTNTPLQSLNLMNDRDFLEAARALGKRMMDEGGPTPEQRIPYAFELATSRAPKQRERDILVSSYRYYLDTLQTRTGRLCDRGESDSQS